MRLYTNHSVPRAYGDRREGQERKKEAKERGRNRPAAAFVRRQIYSRGNAEAQRRTPPYFLVSQRPCGSAQDVIPLPRTENCPSTHRRLGTKPARGTRENVPDPFHSPRRKETGPLLGLRTEPRISRASPEFLLDGSDGRLKRLAARDILDQHVKFRELDELTRWIEAIEGRLEARKRIEAPALLMRERKRDYAGACRLNQDVLPRSRQPAKLRPSTPSSAAPGTGTGTGTGLTGRPGSGSPGSCCHKTAR